MLLRSEKGAWRGALERNKDGLGVGGHTDFFQCWQWKEGEILEE